MAKLTFADLEDKVTEVRYFKWDTLTICAVELENGYKVVGVSACADPLEYDESIGAELAYRDAMNQVWSLEGYLLRQDIWDGAYLEEDTPPETCPTEPPDLDVLLERVPFDWDEFLSTPVKSDDK
jgi:hypothetical protein